MSWCSRCGSALAKEARFCAACGQSAPGAESTASAAQEPGSGHAEITRLVPGPTDAGAGAAADAGAGAADSPALPRLPDRPSAAEPPRVGPGPQSRASAAGRGAAGAAGSSAPSIGRVHPPTDPAWQSGGPDRPSRAHYLWAVFGILGGLVGWLLVRDRDRALGKRVLVAGGVVSAAGIALSIGTYFALYSAAKGLTQSLATEAPTPSGVNPTTAATTTTTTSPPVTVSAGKQTKVWTLTATSPQGYAMKGTLSVGHPQHLQSGLANGSALAGSSCNINSQTAAVIPATLTLTNDTRNFNAGVAVDITGLGTRSSTGSSTGSQGLRWEGDYSSGEACDGSTGSSSVSLRSTNPLSPSQRTTLYGFFVVTGFYSPAHPDGDTTVITDQPLSIGGQQSVSLQTGQDITYTVSSVTGPGTHQVSDFGSPRWSFTLTGAPPKTTSTSSSATSATGASSSTGTVPATGPAATG